MEHFDYSSIPAPEPDVIFGMKSRFDRDPSPLKVNLVIGAYRDEDGKPWVLPCVRSAKERLLANDTGHEYLPMTGDPAFLAEAQKITFGEKWATDNSTRIVSVQSLSGTGALRLGTEFFKRFLPGRKVYIPNPTWANHKNICADSSLIWDTYKYYDENTKGLDFAGMITSLENAPNGSIILLHAVAHNPTGVDPTVDQWKEISKVMLAKKHVTFFDLAYQGFASGDLEKDATAIRLWTQLGVEFFIAQSFAKNFGLYGERTGCLHVVLNNAEPAKNVQGQIGRIVRAMYSNPPSFGAAIVRIVLSDPALFDQWKKDLVTMSSRLLGVRQKLHKQLLDLGTPGDWSHIINQIGMFTYTGLTSAQVDSIIANHQVYMLNSGRISLAGLNDKNIPHVAKAIHAVVTGQ